MDKFGSSSVSSASPKVVETQNFSSVHSWLEAKKPDSDVEELAQQSAVDGCEVDANSNGTKTLSEQRLELLLSNILQYGVLIASAVVLVGGILYLIHHGAEPVDYQFFQGEPSELCSPTGIMTAVLSGSSRGIIQLGLLLLVAVPIIRVVVSLLVFLWQREFTYVIITFSVLMALIYSLVGAH
ncbi:MAG: DUF1634 domain-containing protein [Stigonema ocellatum SAG 48.90 = DSM 106950]|nr:DUF1634 domain-containing protein [Stigonema ocellatum SAG 48.90 = DSM 106950]